MYCMTTEALTTAPAKRIDEVRKLVATDPDARFAISLDHLAYAKDSYLLGLDLVRIYCRTAPIADLPALAAENIRTLLCGLRVLTGQAQILGTRYGALAARVRDEGGSLFDFESDELARAVVASIASSVPDLARKVGERGTKVSDV
jgi:hypothetical protein